MRISSRLTCFSICIIIFLAGCMPNPNPPEIDPAIPVQSTGLETPTRRIRSVSPPSPGQNTRTPAPTPTNKINPTSPGLFPSESPAVPSASPTEHEGSSQTNHSNPVPILINNPSPGSRVVSPIQVVSQLNLKGAKLIRIELRGENDRLLSRVVKSPDVLPLSSATVSIPLLFEIRAAEEPARLSISAEDLYGRLIALNSSEITLLKDGDPVLVGEENRQWPIIILKPDESETISGGSLIVSGAVQPEVSFPLRVELISADGRLLGHKWIADSQNAVRSSRKFSTEVLYSAPGRTPARLIVYSNGTSGGHILYLTSIEIKLDP